MILKNLCLLIISLLYTLSIDSSLCENEAENSVLVVIVNRENYYHFLPYFLHYFEHIDYPKDKLTLYIRSDHNNTRSDFHIWIAENEHKYMKVDVVQEEKDERWRTIMEYKEDGLKRAREMDMDFVWFIDLNTFHTNPYVLHKLIQHNKTVISPMLTSVTPYSNFWGDITETYKYQPSNIYKDIVTYKSKGCFPVSVLTGSILINLKHEKSRRLYFLNYDIDNFDMLFDPLIEENVLFSHVAKVNQIDKFICNDEKYGYILLPSTYPVNVENELSQLNKLGISKEAKNKYRMESKPILDNKLLVENNLQVKIKQEENKPRAENRLKGEITERVDYKYRIESKPLVENNSGGKYEQYKHKNQSNLTYDKIYCINLKRRPERRKQMQENFDRLGLKGTFFDAVDWKDFNETYLKSLDIRVLKNYDKGDVTLGVIANFLSHYFIWQDIAANRYEKAIILEDDVKFHDDFVENLDKLMSELNRLQLDWELVYLGRRIMAEEENNEVEDSDMLVKPDFSWWLIGYMLSYDGAKKLVDQKPMQKIIPADEYVPIMCDTHPEDKYKIHYNPRSINAFAVNPPMLSPTHYRGIEGYVSDTQWAPEVSDMLDINIVQLKQEMQ